MTRAETSALQAMAEESRSRRSSGSLLQRYRGGSKSLSTTPVREILASGGPAYGRALEAEGIMKALSQASPEPRVVKKRKSSPIMDGAVAGSYQVAGLLPSTALGSATTNGNVILASRPSAPFLPPGLTYARTPGHIPQLFQTAGLVPAASAFPGLSNYGAAALNTNFLQAAAASHNTSAAVAYLANLAAPLPPKVARSD